MYSAIALRSSSEVAFIRSDMPGIVGPRLRCENPASSAACIPSTGRRGAAAFLRRDSCPDDSPVQPTDPLARRACAATSARRGGLAEARPFLLREVFRERDHVVALELLGDRRHLVVLAVAALVVAQLQIEIALGLAPDDRRRLFLRNAVLAVAGAAHRDVVFERRSACRCRRAAREPAPR